MQISDALAYLHGLIPQILHRDIKPQNVFLDGAQERIILGDFGLSISMGRLTITLLYDRPILQQTESYNSIRYFVIYGPGNS